MMHLSLSLSLEISTLSKLRASNFLHRVSQNVISQCRGVMKELDRHFYRPARNGLGQAIIQIEDIIYFLPSGLKSRHN